MALISTKQAELAALQAAHAALLPAVTADSLNGLTAATSSNIATYQAQIPVIQALESEIGELQAEAAALVISCAADISAATTKLATIESTWQAFGVALGEGIALSRDGGYRAERLRELSGPSSAGRPQTSILEDTSAFADIRETVRLALAELAYSSGGEVQMVNVNVPSWITA